jgi:Tol biopolymer transport system component
LAKASGPVGGAAGLSMLPTTPPGLTAQGTILGTFQYMAPEQLEGQEADARTDIFAFGVVLYEMLTGHKPFTGKTHASLIGSILKDEPPPVSRLQPLARAPLNRIVTTCLAKDPEDRWQSARDLLRELTWIAEGQATADVVTSSRSRGERHTQQSWVVGAVVVGLMLGAAVTGLIGRLTQESVQKAPEVARLLVGVTPADQLRASYEDQTLNEGQLSRTAMALSPDGRTLVFSAVRGDRQQLYVRSLDQLEAVPIAGTEGGGSPFLSPDGRSVGFWADGALKKVPLGGGPATTLCETTTVFGASWGSNDVIVFARATGGLWQVPAAGGSPKPLTSVDGKNGEVSHRLPQVLPGNQAVMFTVTRTNLPTWDDTQVVLQSLVTTERKVLIDSGADARYVPTGHLVYVRRGTLTAVPFDLKRLAVGGGSMALISDLMQAANMFNSEVLDSGAGQFTVSDSGSLAYVRGGIYSLPERSLVWVDRFGKVEPLSAPPRAYNYPRISPDGKQVVASTQGDRNIWVYDLSRGTTTRLTVDGRNNAPFWTPDGKRVTFGSSMLGPENLFWKLADGSGVAERLTTSQNFQRASSWSRDGEVLPFVEQGPTTRGDIWALSRTGNRQPVPVVQTRFDEEYPEFSPDGHWLAYSSDESGRPEVYVQPYPGPGPRVLISTEGGIAPSWGKGGRELFYVAPAVPPGSPGLRMMVVPVAVVPTFTAGLPRMLFQGRLNAGSSVRGYDVTSDGQRFLMVQNKERPAIKPTYIVLVQNWVEELKARVPTK